MDRMIFSGEDLAVLAINTVLMDLIGLVLDSRCLAGGGVLTTAGSMHVAGDWAMVNSFGCSTFWLRFLDDSGWIWVGFTFLVGGYGSSGGGYGGRRLSEAIYGGFCVFVSDQPRLIRIHIEIIGHPVVATCVFMFLVFCNSL